MSELRVLHDNVLVIPYKQKVTDAGIILSNRAIETQIPPYYVISTIGPDVKNEDLKEGTVVIIPRQTGKWVEFEGFKYILVKESDILCIVEGASYEESPID